MGAVCECWERDTNVGEAEKRKVGFAKTLRPRLESGDSAMTPKSSVKSGFSERNSVFGPRMLGRCNSFAGRTSVKNSSLVAAKCSSAQKCFASSEASMYDNADVFVKLLKEVSKDHPLHDKIDIQSSSLLGCGNYGFILKAKKKRDDSDIVVKLLGTRWEDIAMSEWMLAAKIGEHPNIISYIDVFFFRDNRHDIARILKDAQSKNMLGPQQKRTSLPDAYFCLIEEYMNRGTLQHWIDNSLLLPSSMLMTMRSVASALAHLHQHDVGHNDIKPDNILLSQDDTSRDEGIRLKLADFGLAMESKSFTRDSEMFGMTVYCMAVGEKFGQTQFDRSEMEGLISIVKDDLGLLEESCKSSLQIACADLPEILRRVWGGAAMTEIRDWPSLQGWSFFDGTVEDDAQTPTGTQILVLNELAADGYGARATATYNDLALEEFATNDLQKRKSMRSIN